MIGANILEGYVPEVDATVVERVLDAGGEIAGKAVCEYYCVSGGSDTSSTGPCGIHASPATLPEGHHQEALRSSLPAKWRWRLAATRPAPSAFPQAMRDCWIEADLWVGAPYTGIGTPGDHAQNPRADDLGRRRECAVAEGHRRTGRNRFTPARRPCSALTPTLLRAVSKDCASRCSGRASVTQIRKQMWTPMSGRRRSGLQSSARRSRRFPSRCTRWVFRFGQRSAAMPPASRSSK